MKMRPPLIRLSVLTLALTAGWQVRAADAPKKLLVVTVTTGFRHSSIPAAEATLAQLARESGQFTLEFVRQPEGEPAAPTPPSEASTAPERETPTSHPWPYACRPRPSSSRPT